MVNFPTQIPDCDSHSPALLSFLFLLMLVFVLQWLSLQNLIMLLSQFPTNIPSNSQQDVPYHGIGYDCSCSDWDGLHDYLRNAPWDNIFKLDASPAASEFCEWAQVVIDVYITHRKYQVKPHLSPCFSSACSAAIVHRNHIFCLYQKDKSSDSKVKFRHASNHCRRVLEASTLKYVNKAQESITS